MTKISLFITCRKEAKGKQINYCLLKSMKLNFVENNNNKNSFVEEKGKVSRLHRYY